MQPALGHPDPSQTPEFSLNQFYAQPGAGPETITSSSRDAEKAKHSVPDTGADPSAEGPLKHSAGES